MKSSYLKSLKMLIVCLLAGFLLTPLAFAQGPETTDGPLGPAMSHRLIVELDSPPLAVWVDENQVARSAQGRLNPRSVTTQQYLAQLQAEQLAFVNALQSVLPNAQVSQYLNEAGVANEARYQVVLNAITIDPGTDDLEMARRNLKGMTNVKEVHYDYAHYSMLYTSTHLINAPAAWSQVGGQAEGGKGIKIASMDGGLHHAARMFTNTGSITFPEGYPLPNNRGTPDVDQNNNGKIIVSRAYFRPWDPPMGAFTNTQGVFIEADDKVWPGGSGTSHGVHTGGIAGGNIVDNVDIFGFDPGPVSGVAPAAWMMSYRVFYESVNGLSSFYNAEGIAALEDIVVDGADVVNNSWGAGPGSRGAPFDPLDQALVNASRAGVFVSMSAGNSGPGFGTGDHSSTEYINVAASTTGGTIAAGRVNIIAPEPISDALQSIPFNNARFGPTLDVGQSYTYAIKTAQSADASNFRGCNAWPEGTFTGKAAIISRGICEFGLKVVNAQNAGAVFVVVYNHATGGDGLIPMGAGAVGDQATIPSIFVGHTNGLGIVAWHDQHGDASILEYNTIGFQLGDTPDRIAGFSSRGPAVGNNLKPDIAAPGVNILSQGYTFGESGEARHLGFGQSSGTSMASPHVAGAAALLRQIHPDWGNAEIKSALMSTAKYTDVYNFDGTPAQPLDMGAGRLDLTKAADPGVILDPPSLAFGFMSAGASKSLSVKVTNITPETETYQLSTLDTRGGFTQTQPLSITSLSATSLTLDANESQMVTVTISYTGAWNEQGYVILAGQTHQAHFPIWAEIIDPQPTAQILLIDADLSGSPRLPQGLLPDTQGAYTETLQTLGHTYDVWNTAVTTTSSLPDRKTLLAYEVIIYFTGDNFFASLSATDLDALVEYANNGGILIMMGQDLAAHFGDDFTEQAGSFTRNFIYWIIMGANWLQDSVSNSELPTSPIVTSPYAPEAFAGIQLDLAGTDAGGSGSQNFIDEIAVNPDPSLEIPEAPEDSSDSFGYTYTPLFAYDDPSNIEEGIVAMASREQPRLGKPGLVGLGRTIYTTFGLEGVNNSQGMTSRSDLLEKFLAWAMDVPSVSLTEQTTDNTVNFTAAISPADATATYRWDFGDGSPIMETGTSHTTSHTYAACGTFTARVEVRNAYGNQAVAQIDVSPSQADWCTFRVELSGDQEVPPVASPARGQGALVLDTISDTLYYRIRVNQLPTETVTAAHIHLGEAGQNGGVVLGLYDGSTPFDADQTLVGSATLIESQIADLVAGNYYVNVHTAVFTPGEIRGQIQSVAPPTTLHALLLPENEVPPVDGQAFGTADFTYHVDTPALDFSLSATGVETPTAAHIYGGWPGQNGSPVFDLFTQEGPTFPVIGSVPFTPVHLVDLMSGYYYVNLHSEAFDSGEIRGQIGPPQTSSVVVNKTLSTDGSCGGFAVDNLPVGAGKEVTYCYTLLNQVNSQVTFERHDLVDGYLGTILSDHMATLAPGQQLVVTQTVAMTQPGTFAYEVTFTATNGAITESATDKAKVTVIGPSINLQKSAATFPDCSKAVNTLNTTVNVSVYYCYNIKNTGPITLATHHLTDDQLGTVVAQGTDLSLGPDASTPNFTATHTFMALGSLKNTAIFTAYDIYGNVTTATATALVIISHTLQFMDDHLTTTIQVPAGALSGTERIEYQVQASPAITMPPPNQLNGLFFDVDIYEGNQRLEDFTFNGQGITLTITYDPDADALSRLDLDTLQVWRLQETTWVTDNITTISHDPANNTLVVYLSHASRFVIAGLAAKTETIYLPLVVK